MQYTKKSEEGLTQVVVFNFTKNEYIEQYQRQLTALAQDKSFKVQGFRPGKVPLEMTEKLRGREAQQKSLEKLQTKAIQQYIKETSTRVAALTGSSVSFNEKSDSEFLAFTLDLELHPSFKLESFADITLEKPKVDVDQAVEDMVLALRSQRSVYKEVNKEAEMDSLVSFTSEAKDEAGLLYEPLTLRTETDFVLGSYNYPEDFSAAFVGKKAGDVFTFEYIDSQAKEQEDFAKYTVTVNLLKVQERELPEVDDEFVSSFLQRKGDLEDLKTEIKKNVVREIKLNTVRYLIPQIRTAVLAKYENLDVPQSIIEGQAQEHLKANVERFKSQVGNNEEKLREIAPQLFDLEEYKQIAKSRYIFDTVIDQYALEKNVQVLPAELEAFIDEMSVMFEYPEGYKEEIKRDKNTMANFTNEIFGEKLVASFLSEAKVEDKELSYTDLVRFINSL